MYNYDDVIRLLNLLIISSKNISQTILASSGIGICLLARRFSSTNKMEYNGRIFYDLINLIWSDGVVLCIDVTFTINFHWNWILLMMACTHMLSQCVNRCSIGESCNCKMEQFSIISKFKWKYVEYSRLHDMRLETIRLLNQFHIKNSFEWFSLFEFLNLLFENQNQLIIPF